MNEFIKVLLSLSVSGTLLLLLILGLKPFYKNRFSRRWQYYIWIVVALRFLLPFTPDTTIIGSLFEKFDTTAITNEISTNPDVPAATEINGNKAEHLRILSNENKAVNDAAAQEPPDICFYLFFAWSALALFLFVRKITVYQGFIRYTRAGNKEVSDIRILNLLSDCEEKLKIKTRVGLSCNPLIASPMLVGFFRPRIILPMGGLEDKELTHIFVHELVHYKQRDMFYKWLIQIVVCAHWFNPFVYLLEKEVNKSCELSCDEKAISILGDKAKRGYGDTLVSFLKPDSPCKSPPAPVTLTEGAEQIKERLGAIMRFRKKSKVTIAITTIFTVAACACFFVTGAYAAPSAANDRKTWENSEIRNEMLTEDGVYYIFCDGADESDKPLASVSTGNIMFVLVRQDSYTSIGPFDNIETLIEDVTEQCEHTEYLTEKEKELVIETAEKIVSDDLNSPLYSRMYDYYRTYGQTKEDIQNGYIVNTGVSFSERTMPIVTGGEGQKFYVNNDNTLDVSITLKNLIDGSGHHYWEPITDISYISFEVYDPTGKVAYSFYKEGTEIQDDVDIDTELAVYPGEWRYRISFAYTTNGVNPSNMRMALKYKTVYEDDIRWLIDNKLNKVN